MRIPAAALAVAALTALTASAGPAAATHKKPITKSYDVLAPVAYPVEDGGSHCSGGVEGRTKNTTPFTVPDRGTLVVELSGFLGDWVLELYDAKGELLDQAAAFEPANTASVRKITYQKAKPKQQVKIAVCNFEGSPKAKVRYTFTYR